MKATDDRVTYHCDPDGNHVDVQVEDSTGLTSPLVLTIPTHEIERLYTTLRAAQLGADSWGNL